MVGTIVSSLKQKKRNSGLGRTTQLTRLLEPFKSDPEKSKDRCIRHIEPHFISVLGDERFWIHEQDRCNGDHDNRKPFDCEGREAYFKKVEIERLREALIFFDPDTGLDRKGISRRDRGKYLKYQEVRLVYERMTENAVLMIYQHGRVGTRGPIDRRENRFDRERSEKTRGYFRSRGERLSKELQPKTRIQLISDWEICFFFLTKSPDLSDRLSEVLQQYHDRYDDTTFRRTADDVGN